MAVLGETRDALVGAVLVLVDAARLLVRHFPALLTVFLLGLAVRNAVLWAAVLVGREHAVLASLLMSLAPLAMVVALVVMLRVAGGAMISHDGDRSVSRRVTILTSALVPFLAVYALTGELANDRDQFTNESYADDFLNIGSAFTPEGLAPRSIVMAGNAAIVVVLVFLVIRLVIDLLDLEERHPAWGLVQVLVEVTWLTWLASFITVRWRDAKGWLESRAVLAWAEDAWRGATGGLGPLTDPVRALGGLVADIYHRAGDVVVTPVAWLAVGAVVIVGSLPGSRREHPELPVAARRVQDRLAPGLRRLGSGRVGRKALELLGRRFEDLVDGVRVLLHAGVLPVLTFCLVLPVARLAEWGAAVALRAAIGPRDPDTMIYASTYLDIVTRAAYTLVVVVVVVAAVDRLLLRRSPAGQPVATSIST